jgi:DNA (cytosine-5)-methyltransferase 1
MKPLLLDLFCKAGGASMGYHRAGFDVVGVDLDPQPNYPFPFIQGDALDYVAQYGYRYDAITASPPCQAHSWSAARWDSVKHWPDLIPQTRFMLMCTGKPYIIENVEQAPLRDPITLCGTQFGLKVFRHRKFESNITLHAPPKCSHKGKKIGFTEDSYVTVAGHGGNGSGRFDLWQKAMGIDWTSKNELTQAIPPAYTYWLGLQLFNAVRGIQILQGAQ